MLHTENEVKPKKPKDFTLWIDILRLGREVRDSSGRPSGDGD